LLGHILETLGSCYIKQDIEVMEAGTANTHHAALLRNLPLSDTFAIARHDPTRLPDTYLSPREARPAGSILESWSPRRQSVDNELASHTSRARASKHTTKDYIERSGGRSGQYREHARRSSPSSRVSPHEKVEYIKTSEGRRAVAARRVSGTPRPANREWEEVPRLESLRRESPLRDRKRIRPVTYDYSYLARESAPPLTSPESPRRILRRSMDHESIHTKSGPRPMEYSEAPRRAYPHTDIGFESPSMQRAESADSTKSQKSNAAHERDPFVERQQRFDVVCETISRDDTSGEHSMVPFFVRTAMEPHMRNAESPVDATKRLVAQQFSDALEKMRLEDSLSIDTLPQEQAGSKGKTRMPKRLVHRDALHDLAYPYDEEEDFFVLRIALERDQIDEVIEISGMYKAGGSYYNSLQNERLIANNDLDKKAVYRYDEKTDKVLAPT
jgi:hypothetical protein